MTDKQFEAAVDWLLMFTLMVILLLAMLYLGGQLVTSAWDSEDRQGGVIIYEANGSIASAPEAEKVAREARK